MESLIHHNKIDSRAVSYASAGSVTANTSSATTFSAKCTNPQVSPVIRPTSSPSTASQHLINNEQIDSGTLVNTTCTINSNDSVIVSSNNISYHANVNSNITNTEEHKEVCNSINQHAVKVKEEEAEVEEEKVGKDEDEDWLADEELDMFDIELQREFQSELNSDKVHVFGVNGEQVHIPRLPLGAGANVEFVQRNLDEFRPNNYWAYNTGEGIYNRDNINEHRYQHHYEQQHHHAEDDVNYKNEGVNVPRSKSATKSKQILYSQSSCNECQPPTIIPQASSRLESLRRINGLQNGSLSPGVPTPPLASPFQFANSYNPIMDKNFIGNNNNKIIYHNSNGNGIDYRSNECNYYSANSYSPPFAGCMSYIEQLIHAKQFPSFANTCQMSNITSNRDEAARVVHHLANELRNELHVTHHNANTCSNVQGNVLNTHMTHSRSNSSSNNGANKKNTTFLPSTILTPPAQSQSQPSTSSSLTKKIDTNITPTITNNNNTACIVPTTTTNTDTMAITNNVINTTIEEEEEKKEKAHVTSSESPHGANATLPSLSPRTNNLEDDLALLMLFLQEVAHNHRTQITSPSSPNLIHTARSNANSNSIAATGVTHHTVINNHESVGINKLARMGENVPVLCVTENDMEHGHSRSNYPVHGIGSAIHSHTLTPTSAHTTHRSRSSPAIAGANASTHKNVRPGSNSTHQMNNNNNNNSGGRSTIDSEVCDSLNRLHYMGNSTCWHKDVNGNMAANPQYVLHEHEIYRPVNPYQGICHGAYTTPQQLPQTQYPNEFAEWCYTQTTLQHANGSSQSTALPHKKGEVSEIALLHHTNSSIGIGSNNTTTNYSSGRENVPLSVIKANEKMYVNNSVSNTTNNKFSHHTLHSPHAMVADKNMNTMAASASSSVGRKTNRTTTTNNNGGSVVAHPRAVKPGVSKGKSRGPRSQSGKNVSPSNHSVFSECSGGETRSYQSTNTILRHNTSLSLNATTNTSLSSTTTSYPIREMGNSRGNITIMRDKNSSDDVFINNNSSSNNNTCVSNINKGDGVYNSNVAGNVGKSTRTRATMNSTNNTGLGSVNTLM